MIKLVLILVNFQVYVSKFLNIFYVCPVIEKPYTEVTGICLFETEAYYLPLECLKPTIRLRLFPKLSQYPFLSHQILGLWVQATPPVSQVIMKVYTKYIQEPRKK